MVARITLATLALSLIPSSFSFYLPGAAPRNYERGEKVDLFVNALTPTLGGSDNSKLVSNTSVIL